MSARFPWRREAPSPPLPENLASEQRAADILSLRLSAPEPPPDFIYQRRSEAEPQQKKSGTRWMGPTILALVFAVSIGVGVLVVRSLRDGLVAERSDLPVITAQNDPAKLKADLAFEMFQILGLPFFTFHDRDIAPEAATVNAYTKFLKEAGILKEADNPRFDASFAKKALQAAN